MKKILLTFVAAVAMFMTGCKQVPSEDTMFKTATAIGVSAGYVANQTKIDDKSRAVVIEIMTRASEVVPAKDQSFVDAWTPIEKEIVERLIAEGKLDEAQAKLVDVAFSVVCKGLDYIVTVRYPKAKDVENLVSAAVKGFTGGFLTVFKPVNTRAVAAPSAEGYDKAAYDYLSAAISK